MRAIRVHASCVKTIRHVDKFTFQSFANSANWITLLEMSARLATLSVILTLFGTMGVFAQEAGTPVVKAAFGAPNDIDFCLSSDDTAQAGAGAADAFYAGQYDLIVARCGRLGLAPSDTLVAQALLSQQMCSDGQPELAVVQQALLFSEQALVADEGYQGARLQKAVALSLLARQMPSRQARGLVAEARELTELILAEKPDDVHANAFLAVWHVEVRRRGGRLGALLMGASVKDAQSHYQRAIAGDPDDASVHWQYARALALLDAEKYEDDILSALEAALICHVDMEIEAVMRTRAESLLLRMKTGDYQSAEILAARLL